MTLTYLSKKKIHQENMPIIEIYAPIMSGTEFIKETPPKIKH